ncbi:UxaA family hydrolase [Paenibacillus endoradicis]|uniref:UxaA family hydrolase n=1 Tax=Paenibacillus endoradicis TaxID=2972487 RepID=UPI002158CF61|nr:altronate dehydratase family protein [Paenibacillus endoradicis]MCR8660590.1 altronate dehydratase family protein [Paenibacillus endoradicis]
MNEWIKLHEKDTVAIALRSFTRGEKLHLDDKQSIELLDDVAFGHKISLYSLQAGEHIIKFGNSIGVATTDIAAGHWVHSKNLKSGLSGILSYDYTPNVEAFAEAAAAQQQSKDISRVFQGYVRADGEVGIRNEIWIINTVGCINKTCEIVARRASAIYADRVDGIYHFAHPYGCSQLGDDLSYTQKLLASLVRHPNAAGVLIIGLGCENNQIELFQQVIGDYDPRRIQFVKAQQAEDEIEESLTLIEELVEYAESFSREPIPVSRLKLGLKCGGSDGLSGITANPLVGKMADRLIAAGGTAILTEVPEMFGAETILMERTATEQVFHNVVHLINDFKEYFIRHGQEIYENPSPGNVAGGITTLEEKSLGCTQKGGHAIVTDVIAYGDRVLKNGLTLLEAPGNDLVSVTALSAAGAHIVLFTTGRGTPFGGPVPTVKISTNTELSQRKKNWIDFNAGSLLDDSTMEELSDEFWEQLIAIASGEIQTHNERNGFKEIAIFKDGVTL